MNADERRFAVLQAIVADYVSTHEPVGSKAIVDRHHLNVSSATVRNDMAVLEEDGLIAQPHTSAGRIPTDKGYRQFVDRIAQVKPLSPAERKAVQTFLEGAVDLDDVLRRSVRLLAQLTQQVAVVQYPTLTRSTVRHLEVVALTPARLMLVLITDSGRVDQRVVDLGDVLDDADVARIREILNSALAGQRLGEASAKVAELTETGPPDLRIPLTMIATVLIETLVEHPEERLVLGGTANLTRTRRLPGHAAQRAGGAGGAGRRAPAAGRVAGLRPGHGADRRGERGRGPARRLGRHDRLRRRDAPRWNGRRRADPDGLPRHDLGGACRRPIRG